MTPPQSAPTYRKDPTDTNAPSERLILAGVHTDASVQVRQTRSRLRLSGYVLAALSKEALPNSAFAKKEGLEGGRKMPALGSSCLMLTCCGGLPAPVCVTTGRLHAARQSRLRLPLLQRVR